MNKRQILTALAMAFIVGAAFAQKKVGDYIESVNNNIDKSRSPRAMQYEPKDGAFYSRNGKNRFTRALYGSNTDYRIETSDRPIFAIYKSKNYRSLRFYVGDVQLDEAQQCESYYKEGMRTYVLRDDRWGSAATLHLDVVALPDAEGAVFHFRMQGFKDGITIQSKVCNIANPKLHRNGDMGADKPGCFEPSVKEENLVTEHLIIARTNTAEEMFAMLDFQTISLVKADEKSRKDFEKASLLFEKAKTYFRNLSSRIQFNTPDPYLNTLGSALVLAADGVWDGETWLHGAIGWRMPLAGWRAGYLGDVLGWNERAVKHFDAYAKSQVTDVPVTMPGAQLDPKCNNARALKKWGTEMYSTGYICRNPNRNDQMHHYDMNLNYIDELMWHFQYDADTAYMRKMWPVIKRHLAWEKLNFDSDNDHLYDAYCCIWASDALYYNDGAVTHSSAYNYRGNLLAAKIAERIGEDSEPYRREAEAIRKAMNERLWLKGKEAYVPKPTDVMQGKRTPTPAHWAEYQDKMGFQRKHADAALWSVYTPIDCGVGSPSQMYEATRYVTNHIPHIDVEIAGQEHSDYQLISTSDWLPYAWSINNVASAEIMHTALAFFEAGNTAEGYKLMKSNIMDQMYLGQSPANFGQINYYDAARGECYRDFGDNVGISSRTLIQGFFGIVPQALDGKCFVRPGFPLSWDSCEVKTPYLSYKYKKVGKNKAMISVCQHFSSPLQIVARINGAEGEYTDYAGTTAAEQSFLVTIPQDSVEQPVLQSHDNAAEATLSLCESNAMTVESLGLKNVMTMGKKAKMVDMSKAFNANVSDIFRNNYVSPRPSSTTLQIPTQGIGEWCHPTYCPEITDSVFRSLAVGDRFDVEGIPFATPQQGKNIAFASLWDNYPSALTIPVKAQKASVAHILLAGSTNHMQTHIVNAIIIANYKDGTSDTLRLIPPFNYCPIEQDFYVDGKAFQTVEPRPLRICLGTGTVSRHLGTSLSISADEVYGREIPGGAAQMLSMSLCPTKKLQSFSLIPLSNDIVVGIMGITLR